MNKNLLLAILSGILFTIGWPTFGFPIFLFFAFVPLLFIEEFYLDKTANKSFFLYIYLAFFIWNLLKTWWIYNSTAVGGIFAIVVNSWLMATTFWLFHFVRKRLSDRMALFFFPAMWIAFEKFHLNWDFSWPWLNLGNGFSEYPAWIQWYTYTGAFGGALWILIVNLLIYKYLSYFWKNRNRKQLYISVLKVVGWIIVPIVISLFIKQTYQEKGNVAKVLILQPNLDPWEDKFHYNNTQLTDNLLALVQQPADVIIAPETALSQYTELKDFAYSRPYHILHDYAKQHHTAILTGVDFIHWYPKNVKDIPDTANKTGRGRWYDMYNSAVLIDSAQGFKVYHKSKLVVGAEYTPFKSILVPLIGDWVTETIGVSMGSNVSQEQRSVFDAGKGIRVAPIICYESIYGEYVTQYVHKNANLLAVITNDGWWGNTEGHRQHLSIARLRALENRRDLVQSANTGISAYINQKGEVVKSLGYNKRGSLLATVHLNNQPTFYAIYGDYIAGAAIFMAVLLFLYSFAHKKVRL